MANKCQVCGTEIHPQAYCCKRCKKILDRVDPRKRGQIDRNARLKALKDGYDQRGFFRCHYSGIKLVEDDHTSPRYITFDHKIPRDESDIVIVAQLINDMKSDMTESEFKFMVEQLARFFGGGDFDDSAFELTHWKR